MTTPTENAAEHLRRALICLTPPDTLKGDLGDTPLRMARALEEMLSGYNDPPEYHLRKVFDVPHDEVIVVRHIPFNSLCEHHVLPFSGLASVGYIPSKNIVGLSKIPRMVQGFAKRLQVQERLGDNIADAMEHVLKPKGVAVHIVCTHSCMTLRGVKSGGEMVTSVMRGAFLHKPEARAEVLRLMGIV